MAEPKPPPPPPLLSSPGPPDDKEKRLAEALRANLRRRKGKD